MNETNANLLPPEFPPSWAAGYGEDRQGVFVELNLADGVVMELRWIPPGSFTMGEEAEAHEVLLTSGFWLGRTPVAQAQFTAVTGENPSHFKEAERPVESLDWETAKGFAGALNQKFPGVRAGLPTEAQWEYACRAGTRSRCNNGSDEYAALDDLGWYDKNSGDETHPVAEKLANDWGLFDMHGNVWEWCHDWYGNSDPATVADPIGPEDGQKRVLRGGSYWNPARDCRSTCRRAIVPSARSRYVGFRLAAGLKLESQ